jgi:cytochrome c oxidase subunit 2
VKKLKQLLAGFPFLIWWANDAHADYTLNLTKGVTTLSRETYAQHMYVMWICVAIGVVVFSIMFYSIFHHRKSKGAVAAQFHENTTVEVIWTIVPFIILISMAIPATKAMIDVYDTKGADMTIKVTGYQWKWRYEYLDDGIDFFSSLDAKSNEARQLGSDIDPGSVPNYLLDVDHPLVVPVHKKIRFLFTGADVIHDWWVPALGWKKDTIPGYITDSWATIEQPGVYRGQCAELCGRDHAFMPIVVIAKTEDEYRQWVSDWKAKHAAATEDASRALTKDELMAKGQEVYNVHCAACHQAGGEGVPGTFPAIKGSPIAAGPISEHVNIVLKGKGMMPGFADQLNPADIAAVVTYERNALGNATGDSIQPAEIQSNR